MEKKQIDKELEELKRKLALKNAEEKKKSKAVEKLKIEIKKQERKPIEKEIVEEVEELIVPDDSIREINLEQKIETLEEDFQPELSLPAGEISTPTLKSDFPAENLENQTRQSAPATPAPTQAVQELYRRAYNEPDYAGISKEEMLFERSRKESAPGEIRTMRPTIIQEWPARTEKPVSREARREYIITEEVESVRESRKLPFETIRKDYRQLKRK